jgi:cytochrome c biogenesis protein CcmG/thiol:disulfide interchange protein DsbE
MGGGRTAAGAGVARLIRGLGLIAALAMTGCAAVESAGPPRVGEPARDYAATNLEGKEVALADLRGRVVLLNFWATWCTPCRMETPYLQSVFEEYAEDGFEIVGVSMDTGDAADDVAMFAEEYAVTYTILHDPQMRGMELYQVLGLPATFLIDREGVLRWMRYGPIPEDDPEFLSALDDVIS